MVPIPLSAADRWIVDRNGSRVKFRCINWAGHLEVGLPEGLHHQSIDVLADWIRDHRFNCVRLTYATDHALHPNTTLADAFADAANATGLPPQNLTRLYDAVLRANPRLAAPQTTTRDVLGAVVDALWQRGIMTILDNHVSKAGACCDVADGNGWWDYDRIYLKANSRHFRTLDWLHGLHAMAQWAAAGHPGVVAMSVRNALRPVYPQDQTINKDYNALVIQGGRAVHAAHPHVLVLAGGLDAGTNLATVRDYDMPDISAWRAKHVWEWHAYADSAAFPARLPCAAVQTLYGMLNGFVLSPDQTYTGPLLLSEFGVHMTGGPDNGLSYTDSKYLRCLVDYMQKNDGDWALWALQGSYYVRDGQVDADEPYGVLNHDMTGLRNDKFLRMLGKMWDVAMAPVMDKPQ